MQVKIGDRVRFLNDVGEGTVRKFLDRNIVEVETLDGWNIPTMISELIVVPGSGGEAAPRSEARQVVFHSTQPENDASTLSSGELHVWLLAVRDSDQDNTFSGIRWYLVNDSACHLTFSFFMQDGDDVSLVEKDVLEPGTKIFLQELSLNELSACRGFHIQGILQASRMQRIPPVVSRFVPFQVSKFSAPGAYAENDYLHEPALVFDALKPKKIKKDETHPREKEDDGVNLASDIPVYPGGKKADQVRREVDLHINQLVESVVGMSNRDILERQMRVFESELEAAIQNREREVVFIHGIGNGTLKEKLRKTLETDYPVCSYEDASYKDYGFGATLVIIRQNR